MLVAGTTSSLVLVVALSLTVYSVGSCVCVKEMSSAGCCSSPLRSGSMIWGFTRQFCLLHHYDHDSTTTAGRLSPTGGPSCTRAPFILPGPHRGLVHRHATRERHRRLLQGLIDPLLRVADPPHPPHSSVPINSSAPRREGAGATWSVHNSDWNPLKFQSVCHIYICKK